MSPPAASVVHLDLNRYFAMVSLVILYYDFALTFPAEVERYWKRGPLSWGTVLFFLGRYLAVLGHIPVMFQLFWEHHVAHVIVGVLLMIRTYALYERSKTLKWIMGTVSGIIIGIGCWSVLAQTGKTPVPPIDVGCNSALSNEAGHRLAIAWGGEMFFDCMIFCLTLYKAIMLGRTGRRTLLDIILRDGTMYFGCIAAATLSNILTFLFGPPLIKGVCTIFTNVVSVTLISRLMLNIRDPKILSSYRLPATAHQSETMNDPAAMPSLSTVYPSPLEQTTRHTYVTQYAPGDRSADETRMSEGTRGFVDIDDEIQLVSRPLPATSIS